MNPTPVMRRILAALDKHGDMDARDLAEAACCSHETLTGGGYLLHMIWCGAIRVIKYQRQLGSSGPAIPIYSSTPGPNAKRPRPLTAAQKCKRWRKRSKYRSPEYQASQQARHSLNQLLRITA